MTFDAIEDDIFSDGKAPVASTKITLARTSDEWKTSKRNKSVRDGIDQAIGHVGAVTLPGDIQPNVIQIKFRA